MSAEPSSFRYMAFAPSFLRRPGAGACRRGFACCGPSGALWLAADRLLVVADLAPGAVASA